MQSPTNSPRWSRLGQALLFLLCCAILLAVTSGLLSAIPRQWSALIVGLIASVCTFALTVLFLRWNKLTLADAGAAPAAASGFRFVAGLFAGLVLVVVQLCLLLSAAHVTLQRTHDIGLTSTGVALLTYLALSCREELAFHGYALRRLEQPLGLWISLFIIAIVFGLEHVLGGVSWIHAFTGAAIGSLLFGMAALATRGLAVPIGMHAGWNFGQWVLGGKESPGLWKQVAKPGFAGGVELNVSLSYMVVFLFAILAFWVVYRKRNHSKNCEAMQIPAAR